MIHLPESPKMPSDLADWETTAPIEGGLAEANIFELEIGKSELNGLVIDQCKIAQSTFSYTTMRKLELSDSLLSGCTFLACDLADSSWIRIHIITSRLTGLNLSNGMFRDVVFRGCKLNEANFRMAKLKRCKFVECDLTESDFCGTTLSNVIFENCNLTRSQFSASNVSNLDLRGCDVTGLNGLLSLKGALIDQNQAITLGAGLLREIGIKIDED